jgi:hypothetical protein
MKILSRHIHLHWVHDHWVADIYREDRPDRPITVQLTKNWPNGSKNWTRSKNRSEYSLMLLCKKAGGILRGERTIEVSKPD